MDNHRFHAFAAHCARRLGSARTPELRRRIARELNDWLSLAAAPPPELYELRLTGHAVCWAEPLAAASDEAAIAQAVRRLRDARAVELWSGERWVCRWEQAPEPPACRAQAADALSNRRRGARSGWARRRG